MNTANGHPGAVPATTAYPLNAWYAAAWDAEVGRALLARTVCGRPIALYRRLDGRAAALADTCRHRPIPLSTGSLNGDDIQCGYQGIRCGSGARVPSVSDPGACAASYPVVERHRYVWVWAGDPRLADPALVPDMRWNDDPDWAGDGTTIHTACDYRLVLDNLMDLSRQTYLRDSGIGTHRLDEVPFEVAHTGRTITVTRWMRGIQAPPFWAAQLADRFPGYTGPVDRWQVVRFEAPSTICVDVGVAKAGTGAPEGDRGQGVNGYLLNTVTPESPTSSHHFWAFARNYRLADQHITARLREDVEALLLEDTAALDAQQRAIAANTGYGFCDLDIDAGGMWARRLIHCMVAAEAIAAGGFDACAQAATAEEPAGAVR